MKDEIWINSKGERILVAEMNGEYAKNALRKMIRTYLTPVEVDKTKEEDVVYPSNTDNYGSLG